MIGGGVDPRQAPLPGGVHALTLAGVLDKTEDGRAVFLHDAVHVDFALKAA